MRILALVTERTGSSLGERVAEIFGVTLGRRLAGIAASGGQTLGAFRMSAGTLGMLISAPRAFLAIPILAPGETDVDFLT